MDNNTKRGFIIVGGRNNGGGGGGRIEGAVRYDESQALTSEQQEQARSNIGAGTSDFSGSYNDLTDQPTLFDGSYNSLTDTPNLATVATSGYYTDLLNTPTIPDSPVQSDWNEADNSSLAYIQNKPSIPVLPSYTTEVWTLTLSDNTTITREVYLVPQP